MLEGLHFTVTDIVSILAIIGSMVAILTFLDKRKSAAKAIALEARKEIDQQIVDNQNLMQGELTKLNSTIDKRVGALEIETRLFMPKSDLTTAFAHEKANRVDADNAAAKIIKEMRLDIVAQGKEIAKLEQNDVNHTSQFERFEKRFDKTDLKLDSICDKLSELAKPHS